ncbi:transglycosylase domain-containing protein [Arthrobacter russicus]|jgi:membrane peptidoglycan carboxypeptidase|uniref:Membrane peptidoglycan carboxypeptidase n=1 Tax=Arthrobacter russicus TaxID=172040 RepID=A0ABU1JDB3_9MICC|nr:transglycosylase domain-containing protein [Arthrobacter russicus]MDR6270134.1 membrane peptidoglycan carboxypeptidase [Arthrobacter russicus]
MAVRKNPIINTATTLGKLIGFLGVSVLCGVLVAGLLVPATALSGSTVSNSINAFDNLPAQLDVNTPQGVTNIMASDGTTVLASLYNQNRVPVELDQMSPNIKNAIVAIEDSRFYEHGGVDTTGILRAIVATFAKGDRQGASTITQQYVNNTIIQNLEAAGKGDQAKLGAQKTAGDKIREMKLAIAMEKQYSKEDILKGYLNIVNFANNAYGIQSAAQLYFGVNAADLSLPQAAVLAGVVNSPSYFDPIAQPQNATDRRNLVLGRMLDLKMITQAQHDEAVATPLTLNVQPRTQGCATSSTAPFFCDYVLRTFLNNPDYGATADDRARLLYQGGLTIKTTLDAGAQTIAQDQQNKTSSPEDIQRLNRGSAMVSVEPGTGKIRAMAQNFKMSDVAANGQTSYNFSVPAVDLQGNPLNGLGKMQVGSTMKPFVFAAWLQAGKSMNTLVNGAKRDYPSSFRWTNSCGTTSSNYSGTGTDTPLLPNDSNGDYNTRTALAGLVGSINTITFAEAAQLDICNIKKITEAAGLRTGDTRQPLSFEQASQFLGIDSIDPLTMANAYATFANKGTYCSPIAIESITDGTGKQLPVPSADCKSTIITPEVAAGTLYAMQQVFTAPGGSGSAINPRPSQNVANMGGKTGTTDFSQDTWVVGTTSGLATASWFGNPTGNTTDVFYQNQNKTFNGRTYPRLDGAYIAGTAFSSYMNAVAGNFNTAPFPAPPARMVNGNPPPAPPAQPSPSSPSSPPATPPAAPPASPPASGGTNP